jgi:hypothetical protein
LPSAETFIERIAVDVTLIEQLRAGYADMSSREARLIGADDTLRGVCPQDGDSVEQGTPLATKRLAGQQHETYSALSRAGVADTPASLGMKGSARSLENGHLSSRIFD